MTATLSREERYRAQGSGEDGNSPVPRTKWQKHHCCNLTTKAHKIECSGLSASALSQIVGQAKSTAVARQMQPELIEGLDKALANIDPSKVTSQLILKAFEHAPGLVAQLQQVLDRNTDASASILTHTIQQPMDTVMTSSCPHMKNGLSPGDYLVLQSPIMQSAMLNDEGGQKQNSKPSVNKQQSPTNKSIRQQNTTSSPQKCTIEVSNPAKSCSSAASYSSEEIGEAISTSEELKKLREHRDWADKKIDLLIRRVREAEGPQRELKEEVRQLRLEKNSVEFKLKDFETSLQKLKDCTYTEATQRREFELNLKNTQAELRGSNLREQEVQQQLQEAQQALRQEKKKREAAERRARKASDEVSEVQVSADELRLEIEASAKELELAISLVKEQKQELNNSQTALLEAQQQILAAQQWGREMESQLSASHASASARQEELEGVITALTQQLDIMSHQPQVSLYSHFNGPALFEGSMQWIQSPSFAVRLDGLSNSGRLPSTSMNERVNEAPQNFRTRLTEDQHIRYHHDKGMEVE